MNARNGFPKANTKDCRRKGGKWCGRPRVEEEVGLLDDGGWPLSALEDTKESEVGSGYEVGGGAFVLPVVAAGLVSVALGAAYYVNRRNKQVYMLMDDLVHDTEENE